MTVSQVYRNGNFGRETSTFEPHCIGVDVGTGSARACVVNQEGELVGHAEEDIQQWQTQAGFHVRFIERHC